MSIYIVLIIMTIIGAFGGYFLKKATMNIASFVDIIFTPWIYVGGLFYVIGAIMNIYVLKYLPYTVVLPMTSITYIWTMFIAHIFFQERITRKKKIGICLIICGAFLLGIYKQ